MTPRKCSWARDTANFGVRMVGSVRVTHVTRMRVGVLHCRTQSHALENLPEQSQATHPVLGGGYVVAGDN